MAVRISEDLLYKDMVSLLNEHFVVSLVYLIQKMYLDILYKDVAFLWNEFFGDFLMFTARKCLRTLFAKIWLLY